MSQPLPPAASSKGAETTSRSWSAPAIVRRLRNRRIRRALTVDPRPLLDPERRLIVVFSPKAACSAVVIWSFNLIGLAAEARAFNNWPHRYRLQVYYGSDRCRRAFRDDLASWRTIRVIRDPAERAAGAFRHALRHRVPMVAALTGEEADHTGSIVPILRDRTARTDRQAGRARGREGLPLAVPVMSVPRRPDVTPCPRHARRDPPLRRPADPPRAARDGGVPRGARGPSAAARFHGRTIPVSARNRAAVALRSRSREFAGSRARATISSCCRFEIARIYTAPENGASWGVE